jgi:RHS repeat-associated protein
MKTMTTWTNFATGAGAATTTWNYDPYRGFLTNKAYADGKGPTYAYTPAGRLRSRTWGRGILTLYSYNSAGDTEKVAYSDGSPGVSYTHDRLGRLSTVTQGSTTVTRAYNDAGQLLSETYSGGPLDGLSVNNGYDSLLRRTTLALNSQLSTPNSAAYTYDPASRLHTVSDGTNTATYTYLANSALLDSIVFQQAGVTRMTTTKQHDYLNRLSSISSAVGSSAIDYSYQYNSANQRTAVTNADGSYWAYEFDALGQVTSGKRRWADGTPVAGQQFEYTFDDIGNRQTTGAGGDASGGNLRRATYAANPLNQYTSRTVPGALDVIGAASSNATVTVNNEPTYRKGEYFRAELAIDNRLSAIFAPVTNLAVLQQGPNADLLSTITGGELLPRNPQTFGYDPDGNLTNNGIWTIGWDAENRAVSFESVASLPSAARARVACAYDADFRRIQKTVSTWNGTAYAAQSTSRFVYDGWNLIAEVAADGTLLRTHLWGSDASGSEQGAGGVGGLLATTIHTGPFAGTYFPAYDGNYNVVAYVRATDALVVAEFEYGPFGEIIRASGPMAKEFHFLFSTKYYDWETGFYYYGYRHYDPSTGRSLSRDPLAEEGAANLYSFLANSPLNRIDGLGLSDVPSSKITPWELGWEWLTGDEPKHREFKDGDYFAELLRKHSHIQQLIRTAKSEAAKRCAAKNAKPFEIPESVASYRLDGVQGVGKYLRDYSVILTAGMAGNLAVTFLGSYSARVEVSDIVCCKNKAHLKIDVNNSSTAASALRPPLVGYTPWWHTYVEPIINRLFSHGSGSPTTQHIELNQEIGF